MRPRAGSLSQIQDTIAFSASRFSLKGADSELARGRGEGWGEKEVSKIYSVRIILSVHYYATWDAG